MVNKILYALALCFVTTSLSAAEIETNIAQMQAMDKITGRVSIIEVPVNGAVNFGSFSVVVRSCKARTEEEIPENFAFVDVTDKSFDKEEYNIFKGWMLSSSPAVNAVEHPIYDVWLLKCINGTPKKELLLSADELTARDNLPRLNEYVSQNAQIQTNTFDDGQSQNILFKDAMYKELPAPVVEQNMPLHIEGEPQNLLNIEESYETSIEEMVELPEDDLSKALNNEAQKLIDEETALNQEIDAELMKHQ